MMTQQALADALGLHQSQVSRYCRRGMPMDPQAAKAWMSHNIRLTMRAPLYRRQTTARKPVDQVGNFPTPDLLRLAQDIATIMDAGHAATLAEGAPYLRGVLLTLPDADVARVRITARVYEAVFGEPAP